MCGIFGVATSEKLFDAHTRREAFLNGLLYNLPRGMDSTGAAGFWKETTQGKDYLLSRISKRALNFVDWSASKSADLFLDKFSEYQYVIGHVRATTKGATSDKNAHPFEYGDITLVHNGTVTNRAELERAEENVDSADICATMDKRGEIKTLESLEGGFALVWHNATDDTLNFARNERKPLAFTFIKARNELWYSSEWPVLYAVLMRNKIKLEVPVQVTRPYHHYKFSLKNLRDFKDTEFKKYARPQSSGRTWDNRTDRTPAKVIVHDLTPPEDPTVTTAIVLPTNNNGSLTSTEVPITTEQRLDYINRVLAPWNLKHGAVIVMRATGWQAYKNTKNCEGQLTGIKYDRPDIPISIPHIKMTEWVRMSQAYEGRCVVVITNVKAEGNKTTIWGALEKDWTSRLHINSAQAAKAGVVQEPPKSRKEDSPIEFDEDIRKYYHVVGSIKRILTDKEAADGLGVSLDTVERKTRLPALERKYYGPHGREVSQDEWERFIANGCGECTADIDAPDVDADGRKLFWIGDSPLCTSCTMRAEQAEHFGFIERVH